jgi:hypothetical protein
MQEWIIIVALYALGVGLFHILGGLGAAADAFKDWGTRSSTLDNRIRSSR